MDGIYEMMLMYIFALMWPSMAYTVTFGIAHNHMVKQMQKEASLICYRKELWKKLENTVLLKVGLPLSIFNGFAFVMCNNCYGEENFQCGWSVSVYVFLLGLLLQMLETVFILAVHGAEYMKNSWHRWRNHFGAIAIWAVNLWLVFGGRYNLVIGENGVIMTQLERMGIKSLAARVLLCILIVVIGFTVYRKGKQHFYKKNMER